MIPLLKNAMIWNNKKNGESIGITNIDECGRVIIPKELCDKMGLKPGDSVHVIADDDSIIIRKAVTLECFIEELRGCITVKGNMDSLELKDIWRTSP